MESYSKNDSTDSFLPEQLSVSQMRLLNPNLQTVTEVASPRNSWNSTESHHKRDSARYSLSPVLPQLARMGTEETNDIDKLAHDMKTQNFWKYHIIWVGKNQMYLTTNPDIKHLYCRNGPGYFVELVLPKNLSSSRANSGFRLIFKRQVYDEVDSDDKLQDPKECIVVTKLGPEEGGGFKIVLLMMNDLNGLVKEDPVTIKTGAVETEIPELQELLARDPKNEDLRRLVPTFHRYRTDLQGTPWLVGSNPVAKQKTFNKLKINNDIFKLTGKQNVYFYSDPGVLSNIKISKRHSFLKSLKSESHSSTSQEKLLALFRPHERRLKKKIIKTLNTTGSFESESTTSRSDEYNYIENYQYYKPGDGINQLNPKDDSPNDTKIGWITIFEDQVSVENWELILGFTMAIGFERIIDLFLKDQ